MIVVLLILHGLLAVALLRAVTIGAQRARDRAGGERPVDVHQPIPRRGRYTLATPSWCCLSSPSSAARCCIRNTRSTCGRARGHGHHRERVFEIKEHLAAIGLGLLPVCRLF
jgi:hypothetical protein